MKTYREFVKLLRKPVGAVVIIPRCRNDTLQGIDATADRNPCEVCSHAEYNKLCTDAPNCAALKYHTLSKMPTMVRDFFAKDDE